MEELPANEIFDKLKELINLTPELQEKLESMVEKYRAADDDEKSEFIETVKETFESSLDEYKSKYLMKNFWNIGQSYVVVLIAVILILFIFVFFGYKLYKSLIERERKREEKRRLKELKKKK